ncbi:beta-ketoacyl synthase-like protein [Sinorhizobium americanum]|uniref:Beta-ketoacyl synthase-like protein n=1 Tax=Sinorhizobium americanum TaxID=194963 RepID=A0A4R2B0V7_9HYPH|nr:beta-ketoacyl synthase-like protein [Sinorhizobium americanum]
MRDCLSDARLNAQDVDYLNAHGTATRANDQIETAAIKCVFRHHGYSMSVSSTKSVHAHCLGRSERARNDRLCNGDPRGRRAADSKLSSADSDCDLDVTPNEPRERKVRVALSNAFAMGGTDLTPCRACSAHS